MQRGERMRVNRRSPAESASFAGHPFPPEVILLAVRWYLRYGLSYRDVEELLAERGVEVDHVTIYRWVQRFTRVNSIDLPERDIAMRVHAAARALLHWLIGWCPARVSR